LTGTVFVVLPLALLLALVIPGYWLDRLSGSVKYWVAVPLSLVAAAAPWLVPAQERIFRFFVALVVLLILARLSEHWLAHTPSRAKRDLRAFWVWCLSVAELSFSSTRRERSRARQAGLLRLLRALGKGVALLGCFALGTHWPELHQSWPVHELWCLFAAYWASSGAADLLSAAVMLTTGHHAKEVFETPPLASSPRDFWSRRWNRMFRDTAHRLIFVPLGGRNRPLLAVSGVFLFSAAVHEYLVIAALGQTQGHMAMFFTLHGVATLLDGMRGKRGGLPRPVAVLLHNAWLVLTAPLFFEPLLLIFPAHEWKLW
jgi:hypothetical protein